MPFDIKAFLSSSCVAYVLNLFSLPRLNKFGSSGVQITTEAIIKAAVND
jgi:hypothetical protein